MVALVKSVEYTHPWLVEQAIANKQGLTKMFNYWMCIVRCYGKIKICVEKKYTLVKKDEKVINTRSNIFLYLEIDSASISPMKLVNSKLKAYSKQNDYRFHMIL